MFLVGEEKQRHHWLLSEGNMRRVSAPNCEKLMIQKLMFKRTHNVLNLFWDTEPVSDVEKYLNEDIALLHFVRYGKILSES